MIYLKTIDNQVFKPQEPWVLKGKDEDKQEWTKYKMVCYVTELENNAWQIDYYDHWYQYNGCGGYFPNCECHPNKRLILYPSSIKEIAYHLFDKEKIDY
jgi:hypothetical protein